MSELENKPAPQPAPGRKALTAQNKIFLDKLADGVPCVDAYRLAGYTGSNHTAYEMRRQLKAELRAVLEARGFTIEGVASEILNLSKLPVDLTKYPNGIPLNQKLQILRLFAQTVKEDQPKQAAPNVTAFIIQRGGPGHGSSIKVNPANVIPGEAIPEEGKQDHGKP